MEQFTFRHSFKPTHSINYLGRSRPIYQTKMNQQPLFSSRLSAFKMDANFDLSQLVDEKGKITSQYIHLKQQGKLQFQNTQRQDLQQIYYSDQQKPSKTKKLQPQEMTLPIKQFTSKGHKEGFYEKLMSYLNQHFHQTDSLVRILHTRSRLIKKQNAQQRNILCLNISKEQNQNVTTQAKRFEECSINLDPSIFVSAREISPINLTFESSSQTRIRTSYSVEKSSQNSSNTFKTQKYFCSYLYESLSIFSAQSILDLRYIERIHKLMILAFTQQIAQTTDIVVSPQASSSKVNLIILGLEQTLISLDQSFENKTNNQILVFLNPMDNQKKYINIRPNAGELIKKLNKHFEIGIFTGLDKKFADSVLKILDPEGMIHIRYYKDSCRITQLGMVKDLRMLQRPPKTLVFVDSVLQSVLSNISNSIPIIPFHGQNDDRQLLYLYNFLMDSILKSKDVQKTLNEHFQFKAWIKFKNGQEAVKALYHQA